MLPAFRMHAPASVPEAAALLAEHGEDARIYAGGTELLLVLKAGFLACDHLVDIKAIPQLTGVTRDGTELSIGAATTYRELQAHPDLRAHLPELVALIGQIANVRVRASGTLGGNLCFVEPHSDPATLLLAYDATVECQGGDGSRRLPLGDFLVGPFECALRLGELLTRIHVPLPGSSTGTGYQRFVHLERPAANAAVRIEVDGSGVIQTARIAVGAVGPVPARQGQAEELLLGISVAAARGRADGVAEAVAAVVDVMEDAYGSSEYKRSLSGELCRRALLQALEQLARRGDQRG